MRFILTFCIMLVLLNDHGYRGFNRFLMNPSASQAAREVEWMAELRPQLVPLVVQTTGAPAASAGIAREEAIAAARADRQVQQLLRAAEPTRVVAEFSDRYGVWLVHFYAGDRPMAFASVSREGEVVEAGRPKTDE